MREDSCGAIVHGTQSSLGLARIDLFGIREHLIMIDRETAKKCNKDNVCNSGAAEQGGCTAVLCTSKDAPSAALTHAGRCQCCQTLARCYCEEQPRRWGGRGRGGCTLVGSRNSFWQVRQV
jgi:hypothetical protein